MTMTWQKYELGTTALCGYCAIEHAIIAIRNYSGRIGFVLGCGHRNGFCEKCDLLVRDSTDQPLIITPECPSCGLV